jgi:hypothetical protein
MSSEMNPKNSKRKATVGLRARDAFLAASVLAMAFATSTQTFAASLFSQGFESDASGWFTPSRVASGTDGVTSASGGFHAETAQNAGDFTRWGGYNSSTGGVPGAFQPYTTSIDIYLNTASGAGNDTRFDFSSAINDASGNFLRDFVFNAGFYSASNNSGPGAGTDRFVISASNNAGRANSFPMNPGRNPIAITTTGWYTFQETFSNSGGFLSVNLSVLDSTSALLGSWILGGDPIGTVGGNRYGWFVNNEFPFLAIDNSSLTTPVAATPLPAAFPLFASGIGGMGLLARRRKRTQAAV